MIQLSMLIYIRTECLGDGDTLEYAQQWNRGQSTAQFGHHIAKIQIISRVIYGVERRWAKWWQSWRDFTINAKWHLILATTEQVAQQDANKDGQNIATQGEISIQQRQSTFNIFEFLQGNRIIISICTHMSI